MSSVFRGVAVCALLFASAALHAMQPAVAGEDVPAHGSWRADDSAPRARMLSDAKQCELIAAVRRPDGALVSSGEGGVLIFRKHNTARAFLRQPVRADGLMIAVFQARPGERVLGRAYTWNLEAKRWDLGPRVESTCRPGMVTVGGPEPAR